MTSLAPCADSFPFLTGANLGAWIPHPTSGMLAGPRWNGSLETPLFDQHLILDGRGAQNALDGASRVLADCGRLVRTMRQGGFKLHQPLPMEGAGWILSSYYPGLGGTTDGRAVFVRDEKSLQIEMDLRSPSFALFEAGLRGETAEVMQMISIDRGRHTVTTEYYSFQVQFREPATAIDFAAAAASLAYECGQYAVDTELGPLMLRDDVSGQETPMEMKNGRFSFTGFIPNLVDELMLVSSMSVFEPSGSTYREAVVSLTVSPLDLDRPSTVKILLYRPTNRPTRRMPLHARLKNVLWETLQKKVSGS